MNAEGKRDVCGQKHERKSTRSFFILCSGGRIYFLACTADAPFLWVSFPYVSCQARVLMKQNDTGSLSLTPLHPSNSPVSASQECFSQPLFIPFSQEQDQICEVLFDSSLEKVLCVSLPWVTGSCQEWYCQHSVLGLYFKFFKQPRGLIEQKLFIFHGTEGLGC